MNCSVCLALYFYSFAGLIYYRENSGTMEGGMIELTLDPHLNKTGDIWHICIEVLLYSDCLKFCLVLVFS